MVSTKVRVEHPPRYDGDEVWYSTRDAYWWSVVQWVAAVMAALVVVGGLVFGISALVAKQSTDGCHSQWPGREASWSRAHGCMVVVDGQPTPANNIVVKENRDG